MKKKCDVLLRCILSLGSYLQMELTNHIRDTVSSIADVLYVWVT